MFWGAWAAATMRENGQGRASSIVAGGWGVVCQVGGEKSSMLVGVLVILEVAGGLTCGIWVVFGGGFEDLFSGGGVGGQKKRILRGDHRRKGKGKTGKAGSSLRSE